MLRIEERLIEELGLERKFRDLDFKDNETLYITPPLFLELIGRNISKYKSSWYMHIYFFTSDGITRARIGRIRKNIGLLTDYKKLLKKRKKRGKIYALWQDRIWQAIKFIEREHNRKNIEELKIAVFDIDSKKLAVLLFV